MEPSHGMTYLRIGMSTRCYTLQVGQCKRLHVLSLRENELLELPEEVGQLEDLTVLDIVGNR